jgi:hypothetical protein
VTHIYRSVRVVQIIGWWRYQARCTVK